MLPWIAIASPPERSEGSQGVQSPRGENKPRYHTTPLRQNVEEFLQKIIDNFFDSDIMLQDYRKLGGQV